MLNDVKAYGDTCNARDLVANKAKGGGGGADGDGCGDADGDGDSDGEGASSISSFLGAALGLGVAIFVKPAERAKWPTTTGCKAIDLTGG